MNIFKQLFGGADKMDLKPVIDEGAYLVDVRTAAEFSQGHVKGSVNVPLDTIPSQIATFNGHKNIIVFCRSGARSSQAKAILEQNGVSNVINGGSWEDVAQIVKTS